MVGMPFSEREQTGSFIKLGATQEPSMTRHSAMVGMPSFRDETSAAKKKHETSLWTSLSDDRLDLLLTFITMKVALSSSGLCTWQNLNKPTYTTVILVPMVFTAELPVRRAMPYHKVHSH